MIHSIVHWMWRHAWGVYEVTGNGIARRAFDTLDRLHDQVTGDAR